MGSVRLQELDALRAFALCGILMVNIWYFADPFTAVSGVGPAYESAADLSVRFLVGALFEAKFYILFSFLFGYSFVLQWAAAGGSVVPRTLRRFAALFILGLAHGLLLWFGDILLVYALMGLILLATRMMRSRPAFFTGIGITVGIGGLTLLLGLVVMLTPTEDGLAITQTVNPDVLTQNPASAFAANLSNYLTLAPAGAFIQGPLALAMFYVGMAAGKARLLEGRPPARVLMTAAAVCLPIGLAAGVFQSYLTTYVDWSRYGLLAMSISILTAPLLTAGYVSLLLLLFRTAAGRGLMNVLAPAGRMALTNYLLQSVAMVLIFTAFGLGLSNRLPALTVAGVVVAIFGAQLALSRLYLSRFQQGPAEWLLRRVTYWGTTTTAIRSSAE